MTDAMPTPSEPKRYAIDNVAALIRVMHADRAYALALRNKAEQHVTLTLRRKYYRTSPELIVDAFNTALMNFLRAGTFRPEGFLSGRPAEGWSAKELGTTVLGGYLYRSAHRELIRLLRQRQHEDNLEDDDRFGEIVPEATSATGTPPPETPETIYERKERRQHMLACVAKLSDTLRDTLFWYLDDYSYAHIAKMQNINPQTVKSRIAEARNRVIECVRKRMV